jgi:hypothetical protein
LHPDANHLLPTRPMASILSEPAPPVAAHDGETDGRVAPGPEDVGQLAAALRAAERAHRGYLAELRQGDVEPVEDWSTWYAEYLLGLR